VTGPGGGDGAGTVVIRSGVIVYASDGVGALAGREIAEIVGRPFAEFLAPGDRDPARERYALRLRGEPVPRRYELTLALPGGGERRVEVHAERDGKDLLVHLRDAGFRQARRLRLEAVAALGAAIQGERTEHRVHARVESELRALGLYSSFARAEPDGLRVLWTSAPPGLRERFAELAGAPYEGFLARWTPFTRSAWTEGWAFSDDWAAESAHFAPEPVRDAYRDAVRGAGEQRAIVVRVDQREAAECVLLVVGDWLRTDDAPAVRLFGAQIAAALDAARTIADLSRRNDELAALNRVAELATEATDLDAFFACASDVLRSAAGCAGMAVFVLDEEGAPDLVRAYVDGTPPAAAPLHEHIPLDGPWGPVVRERATLVVDVASHPERGRLSALGFETLAWVPLVIRARTIGLLATGYHAPSQEVRRRIGLLSAVAAHLAAAIESRGLLADLRRRVEELSLVNEVGRSLVATLDIERVLEAGVRNIARIVDTPDAYLLLPTPDGRHLEIAAVAGGHREHLGKRLPADPPEGNLPSLVLHRREPLVIEDALLDPRVNQALRAQTAGRGYLGLPLTVRDRTIGALLIVEPRRPRLFTPAEVERAAGIANQLAVAVENARLYEDVRRSYEQLERAQQRLVRGERLAALGELSAIVAHEVRNPLGVIFNSLGSLRRLLRPTGDAQVLLDIVGEEADRLNRIVGDLLDFARPATPELRPESLARVVEEAVGVALAQRPPGVEVVHDLDPALPLVRVDVRLVRQAVLNVAVNAVQAMPRGGRITVRTRREPDAAVVELEDTGTGIPDEVKDRIFEPFFTTKASGTGLGLAVVKRIVEGHGGTITAASRPGQGTRFLLRFPLAPTPVEMEPPIG
jgi:two-component system, NtrC family, sensor histidine kinase HydH